MPSLRRFTPLSPFFTPALRRAVGGLIAITLTLCPALAAEARTLQCVPYARTQSQIAIHGNAATWWEQARGTYARGHKPEVGAVLVFESTKAMPYGHVAVIGRVVDDRHVLLDHANWSRPGMIEHAALATDVSEAGDWSEVRVWFDPSGSLGARVNPAYGFIYGPDHLDTGATRIADAGSERVAADGDEDARSAG